jgi:hypothetical protein
MPSANLNALLAALPTHLQIDIHHSFPQSVHPDADECLEIFLTPKPVDKPSPPRPQPSQPRRPRPRTGQATPYGAKRAAMEDLEIRRLRRDGFTPYFGDEKRFLMTPPEFGLVLACESRYVVMVIFEVLTQSVGYAGQSETGRREWVVLSKRHFERRGLMSESQARRALGYAVSKGYLLRRRRGQQRWEYAVHYRQADIVPH